MGNYWLALIESERYAQEFFYYCKGMGFTSYDEIVHEWTQWFQKRQAKEYEDSIIVNGNTTLSGTWYVSSVKADKSVIGWLDRLRKSK